MQAFRDMVRGWLGKALLVLLMVPFALVGIESYFVGGGAAPVATVNDEEISQFELDRSVEQQKQRLLANMGEQADAARIDAAILRQEVLKNLIDAALLKKHANKQGFVIDDAGIIGLIQQMPAFQENGVFSQARYEQVLGNAGEDPINFPAKFKKEMAVSQLTDGISKTAFVTPKQFNNVSDLYGQKRDIHIATVSAASYLPKVQVTEADVAAHYKAHTSQFTTQEKVSVDYLVLGAELFLDKVLITDADVEARYAEKLKTLGDNEQRRAAHILIKTSDAVKEADALTKIKALEKRIQAGEDFGALAKQYSQDEGSAINNGDLGFVGKGAFVPEFEKTMYTLKPNGVSAPVKTQFGYHIIKLLEVQKAAAPLMADIRSELEADVRMIKSEELYNEAIEKMDALAYESSDLSEGAKQYSLTVQASELFAKNGNAEGLAANRKIVQAAFSDDILKDGKNSSALALDSKHSVWIHLNKHEVSRVKPLAEVSDAIKLSLQLDKASVLAKQAADSINKALNEGKPAAELAASYGLQWQDFVATARTATAPLPNLLKVAFRLAAPKTAWTAAVTASGKDFAIVAVSKIDAAVSSLSDEEKKQFLGALTNMSGQQELQDYLVYLRANAKIKQNKEAAN